MWALLVAIPLVVAVKAYDDAREWWQSSELIERPVMAGTRAQLGGAEWRLADIRLAAERPDGSAVALVQLEAVVGEGGMTTRLPCKLVLRDAQGRQWLPTFLPAAVRSPDGKRITTTSCNTVILSKPQPGAQFTVTESFILPRAAFDDVTPTLSVAAERPMYLRFLRKR
ncbi:hypothetical protein [Bradyrhizobium sp. LHD-71]|uniref:hypothetical protein n=1 Tax=Bradyrhizobium sp. LHD-71 TaxID=3072141 RepID=UPI00280CD746|nr:hypothetical protein [Bradyrhizobium sp. LHD-71]MDQ8730255.1 hypothetical protein [Bradyrhizobium sp. LHD-71]